MQNKIIHPSFGDLSSFEAVKMSKEPLLTDENYIEDESILIHLTVTGRCYARCIGCVNSAVTMGNDSPRDSLETCQETEPEQDSKIIELLTKRHPDKPITVCFYGGEPFLALDKMQQVWKILRALDTEKRFRFLVYTNGELLIDALKLYSEFMKDIWVFSVSIDGSEEQHNRVRHGTRLSKILKNLKMLSSHYEGNILFWSTLRESQSLYDCFEEFFKLYKKKLVNHFFWHWAEDRKPFLDFSSYAIRYGQELEQIMSIYVQEISKGKLLPITHINELILYFLTGKERGHSACGVEVSKNYDIVSSEVYPCADLPSNLSIGKLDKSEHLELRDFDLSSLVDYKNRLGCYRCGVHAYCGGRCPVQVIAGSWQRTLQYCQLMRLHVGIVQENVDGIINYIRKNGISLQDIYDRSAFLAKYTDVVP
ncbi:MAG: radical SAM protein [Candidatus Aminicenantaceae bacterium]